MQREKNLHQLFRARLPIAVLPKEFADRLTKAVLNEVAQLHQANQLASNRDECVLGDTAQPDLPTTPKDQLPFNRSTAMLLFVLLLQLPVWPFLQGCTVKVDRSLAVQVVIDEDEPVTKQEKVSAALSATVVRQGTLGAIYRTTRAPKPPLGPVKPQLPGYGLQAEPLTLSPTATHGPFPTPTVAESDINQQSPPIVSIVPLSLTAVTIAQEQPTAPPATPPQSPVTPTPEVPQPELTATASLPTSEATPLTPEINIFEPTLSPTPVSPEAPAIATPTPTLYIRPWQTPIPEPNSTSQLPATTDTPTPTS